MKSIAFNFDSLDRIIINLRISIQRSWRRTSKDESQFLWRRSLEKRMISEL